MVVVNKQYDAYENFAEKMSQKDIDRASENLVAIYPGLTPASCGTCNLNQYNMTLANEGGVGIQIARVYINSTTQASQPTQKGCSTSATPPGPCVLNPFSSATSFGFAQTDSYVAAGEFNHIVRFWLPAGSSGIVLPNVTLTPSNSIWIVTSRGRVFSFNWPIPPAGRGQGGTGTPLNLETGSMKIAYNGTYTSKSDPCHTETPQQLPAGGHSTSLYFVNPWITPTILNAAPSYLSGPYSCTSQCLFISVYSENTRGTPISFSWGQLILLTAVSGANSKQYFIGADYVGIVTTVNNQFYGYGTLVTVQPGQTFYLIYEVVQTNYSPPSSGSGDLFTGTATVNNGFSTQNEGSSYQAFSILLDGLYVRNNGGC